MRDELLGHATTRDVHATHYIIGLWRTISQITKQPLRTMPTIHKNIHVNVAIRVTILCWSSHSHTMHKCSILCLSIIVLCACQLIPCLLQFEMAQDHTLLHKQYSEVACQRQCTFDIHVCCRDTGRFELLCVRNALY